ncbi:MAG TPA: hypothetical protein VHG51_13900 [Longimicrobiaceae bacterium]|nr:hypothetical protein [Longimicrobiaceae bacterium]
MGKSARTVAEEIEVSRTAYNNFAHGRTKAQDRVTRKVGLLYLSVPPELRRPEAQKKKLPKVAETPAQYGPGSVDDELRRIVPAGREEALRWVDDVFGPARGNPGAGELEEVVRRWIDREYPPGGDAEPPAKRRRK